MSIYIVAKNTDGDNIIFKDMKYDLKILILLLKKTRTCDIIIKIPLFSADNSERTFL